MSDVAIRVENVSKVYKLYDKPIDRLKETLNISNKVYHKDHYALNDISFEVKKGETVGIIGTNGSGKSTLLKMITGVLTPTSGNIEVNGKVSALLELGAGFNPEYTGMENIYLNGTMMGYSREEMESKVQPILEFADIGEFINQPVKTYSSGMFARLAFAVAINVEPEILIVDEALSVGDTRFQIKCMNKMKQMMEGGTTVLFVSHDTNSIKRFCSKALWIDKGIFKGFGDTDTLTDRYLDFLKHGNIDGLSDEVVITEEEIKPFTPGDNIAEIVDFSILDINEKKVNQFEKDQYIKISVTYDVYDENIQNPVLGIAIKGMDDDYVCGLNTLLDKVKIPWKYGRNKFYLEYPNGILAVGGKYYFDTALFEETATVPIQYISMVKEFTIVSEYVGEGRYIIPHLWKGEYDE